MGGFTDPQGKRVGLGALLVGYFEGDDFVFAGKIGTGFDTKLLLELRARLDQLEIPKSPFTKAVGLPRLRAHWVRPEIVVQVGFIEWTVHGKLRHPRLLGVRDDRKKYPQITQITQILEGSWGDPLHVRQSRITHAGCLKIFLFKVIFVRQNHPRLVKRR